MFLKIMGSENMPDHISNKTHDFIEVSEYSVHREGDGTADSVSGDVFITYTQDGRLCERRVFSNIYVMNRDGKTINTVTPTPGVPH